MAGATWAGCRGPPRPTPTRRAGALGSGQRSSGSVENVIKGARFTEADAEAQVHGICFKTGPPERVGVELEWLVRDRRDPALPVQAEQVAATLAGFEAISDERRLLRASTTVRSVSISFSSFWCLAHGRAWRAA